MNTSVTVENLSLAISGKRILQNISFETNSGDVFAILGSNGSGKSLLIDCLLGNISSTYDKNTLCEEVLNKKELGILYDNFSCIPLLKIEEILKWLEILFESKIDYELAEHLGIKEILNKQLKVLSKGENKKVGVYAALFHKPRLIILDEPTDGLDPIIRDTFWKILLKTGSTIIFTTHIWHEVENTASKVLFLYKGRALNVPMPPDRLIATHLPYKGKVALNKADKDVLLSQETRPEHFYCFDDELYYFFYTTDIEKNNILMTIMKKKINYSVLSIELKDVYRFLIKNKLK